ncbi:signal peptidase I [Halorutilales archaeon Cl-col2-1]
MRQAALRLTQYLVALLVVASVVGSGVGQPVVVGYVSTDSMEPELEPGDGFVAVPSFLTQVDEGDVVVYENPETSSLTTHRVVRRTNEGYITKGDANPFTDQDRGIQPVTRDQIVATPLQLGGDVVRIPHIGDVSRVIQWIFGSVGEGLSSALGMGVNVTDIAYTVLGVSGVGYVYETLRSRHGSGRRELLAEKERRQRILTEPAVSPQVVRLAGVGLVVVSAAVAMYVPSGSHTVGVVSAEFESDADFVVETGETEAFGYTVSNSGYLPVVSYTETQSTVVNIRPRRVYVSGKDSSEITVEVEAPDETGYYPSEITERRYIALIPAGAIDTLHRLHPWLPYVAVLSLLGVTTYGVGLVVVRGSRAERILRHWETAKVSIEEMEANTEVDGDGDR